MAEGRRRCRGKAAEDDARASERTRQAPQVWSQNSLHTGAHACDCPSCLGSGIPSGDIWKISPRQSQSFMFFVTPPLHYLNSPLPKQVVYLCIRSSGIPEEARSPKPCTYNAPFLESFALSQSRMMMRYHRIMQGVGSVYGLLDLCSFFSLTKFNHR